MASATDVQTLLMTTRCAYLAPLLRDLPPASLVAASATVAGVCATGASGAVAVLVFIGVLLEKGGDIRPAELVSLAQSATNALEAGQWDAPTDREYMRTVAHFYGGTPLTPSFSSSLQSCAASVLG